MHLHYKGLIQCTVSAPDHLYLPLLPHRARGRLMFGLCAACMDGGVNAACTHTGEERYLRGVYTHVELTKAVEDLGYRVVAVSEVWHFDTWENGLFEPYINRYFAIKEEVCISFISREEKTIPLLQ